MKNIYLVGFMGTGKTAVAKILASKLSKEFVEMDAVIESQEGLEIKDIFAQKGENYFRNLENNLLKKLSKQNNFVVSCGGGVVCNSNNIKLMRQTGFVFCLFASASVIFQRIKNQNNRPLLNVKNPLVKIEELFNARKHCYQKAGERINTDGRSPSEVADFILKLLSDKKAIAEGC